VEIVPGVLELILNYGIDSMESIEILLLLRRSEAFWTSEAVAQQLGIPKETAAQKLAAMARAQLLAIGSDTGAYRYAPRSEAAREALDKLANLERLRAFSDAFRLKSK
jgi:DNA-binding IclR family transcriptional regulator